MTSSPPARSRPDAGASLATKLALLVAGGSIAVAVVALALFLPHSRTRFLDRTEDLLVTSQEGMFDIADRLIESHRSVVIELATHIADTHARELADLPLSLADGDESKIREMILAQMTDLRRRTVRNVEVIGEELRFRSEEDVADEMARQRALQRTKGREFARGLQAESVFFVVLLVLTPLPILFFGLFRMVVRPIARLATATGHARGGDLSSRVPVGARDEIGSLQASFNGMMADLETSRARIEDWNATLERRVEEKTEELRHALSEQRRTTRRLEATLEELRSAQGALIQAEKMAGLGNMAASVAHEFNNLLGGILGSAQSALEETPEGTAREALEVVRRAARRACVVTENLLRFSRREETHKEPADLNGIVRECLQLVEPDLNKRSIRSELRLGELPPTPLDSGQIHQVVLNLLSNAIRAVDPGGRIGIETGLEPHSVRLCVEDDGPGVPHADRDRVFEPFYTTRTAADGGTGLGLAVSYGIVTAHGGRIRVEDRPGGGSRFIVELPLDSGASQERT